MNSLSFIGANTADALSTFAALNVGAQEANPLIGVAIEATNVPTVLIAKVIIGVAVALFVQKWRPRLLTIPTVVFAVIALSNSLVVFARL